MIMGVTRSREIRSGLINDLSRFYRRQARRLFQISQDFTDSYNELSLTDEGYIFMGIHSEGYALKVSVRLRRHSPDNLSGRTSTVDGNDGK
jgi:hypothetical protein